MAYVITCGDEGVQINEGRRLGFAGSGYELDGFPDVVKILKSLFGKELAVVASQENDWIKSKLDLATWEQVNASAQQHITALADKNKLNYAGYLPFADPKNLEHGIRGHMVRPHNIHIANKICFTFGGGEQTYNLGCYVISADWVGEANKALIKKVIAPQIAFYRSLDKETELTFKFEEAGELGEKVAAKNKKALEKSGVLE